MAFAKYSDEGMGGGLSEHKLHINPARKYDPSKGGDDGEGSGCSMLGENSMGGDFSGDWSFKPWRDKRLGVNFVTFLGVPRSAAELYGPRILS